MATDLLRWMKLPTNDPESYAARYPSTAEFFEEHFGTNQNIEDLVTEIEARLKQPGVGYSYSVLKNAVRSWFREIQQDRALKLSTYQRFANNLIVPGDWVITFNYDVSLDRELRLAGRFEAGDGYGFAIQDLPVGSATRLLKLHGSTSWLAPLFGGMTTGPFQFHLGQTLTLPIIAADELSFLGYDPTSTVFPVIQGTALPVMIFPERSKYFYFAANTGIEYVEFWDELWRQAETALNSTSRLVICGYSLPPADERACQLLLNAPPKHADVMVVSGNDTGCIVNRFKSAGYAHTGPGEKVFFGDWINQ